MGSCADEVKLILLKTVDQEPIRREVTLPAIRPVSGKGVRPTSRGKGLILTEKLYDMGKLVQIQAPLARPLPIFEKRIGRKDLTRHDAYVSQSGIGA